MKKTRILSLFLIVLLIVSIFNSTKINVTAQESNQFTYEDYLTGVEEGWIGEDVTYEMIIEMQ